MSGSSSSFSVGLEDVIGYKRFDSTSDASRRLVVVAAGAGGRDTGPICASSHNLGSVRRGVTQVACRIVRVGAVCVRGAVCPSGLDARRWAGLEGTTNGLADAGGA